MPKTVIDINDELLEAAAQELGTRTKKDTVNEALRLAAQRATRVQTDIMLWGEDITDPEIMARARR